MPAWRKICCPVDFSETSRAAMRVAAELARKFEATLTLFHVVDVIPVASVSEIAVDTESAARFVEKEARDRLERWGAAASDIAGTAVRCEVARGVPTAEILRFVDEGHYDLVVTGTHGRTALKRVLLGSIAEVVVRKAHAPVLVVRAPRLGLAEEIRMEVEDG